jgi:mitochondrial cardiolipin hydrolase
MRRIYNYLLFIFFFFFCGLVLGIKFYPHIKPYLPSANRAEHSLVPVATPGSAVVEGPYFSDGDRVADRIISAIHHSRKSIHAAIYDLTQPDIAAALADARKRDVEIKIVADEHQSREPHSEISYLRSHGLNIRLSNGYKGSRSIMHNKFAVFDGKMAETGSFNWTTSADGYNYENAIFIADPTVVEKFSLEFDKLWSQAQ